MEIRAPLSNSAQFEHRKDNVRGVANEINLQGAVESKITGCGYTLALAYPLFSSGINTLFKK